MRTGVGRTIFVIATCVAIATATPTGTARAAGRLQVRTEPASGVFDATAADRAQQALHSRLWAEQVRGGVDAPLAVAIDDATLAELRNVDRTAPRLEVGVTRRVSVVVDFADLTSGRLSTAPQSRVVGAARGTQGGGFVWTGAIRSEEASALRIRFSNFSLPDGAALHLYNTSGTVRGPYVGAGPDGSGEFWSHTVAGPLVILQLSVPASARGHGGSAATFDIDEVGHLGPSFPLGTTPISDAGSTLCSYNEPCIQNASCGSIPAAIAPARDAVAMIQFVSGGFIYLCSGGLVADTDATTQIPYFLTAHHCLSRSREARSLEAFFQYSVACGGACYDPDGVVPSTLGSDVVGTDTATDYTLLRLREPAPAGSAFFGWSSTPIAFTNGVSLFRISHPAGAPQAYSTHVVDVSRPTCSQWTRGNRIYSSDTFGGTEGGSSGSPVLNQAGQVVGQLSGACGYNVGDPCDDVSNATVDGAFAAYFAQVADILAPGGGSTTTSTTVATTSTVATTTSTVATTSTTVVSSTTTTSTTLPGTCGLPGDACTTASDCCSSTCRGRPGNRTCK